jgi:hypothetical protein
VVHGPEAAATRPVIEDIVESEIAYTFAAIEKVKLNESAWNYLVGMKRRYRDSMPVVMSLSIYDRCAVLSFGINVIMTVTVYYCQDCKVCYRGLIRRA